MTQVTCLKAFLRPMKQGKDVPKCANSAALGRWGETLAAQYLVAGGYRILERNWRSGRSEIDLIALHEGAFVFIEVKLRSERGPVVGLDSLQETQQARIIHAAHRFLCTRKETLPHTRFDVICIRYGPSGWRLDHWVEAFHPLFQRKRQRIRTTPHR